MRSVSSMEKERPIMTEETNLNRDEPDFRKSVKKTPTWKNCWSRISAVTVFLSSLIQKIRGGAISLSPWINTAWLCWSLSMVLRHLSVTNMAHLATLTAHLAILTQVYLS